MILYLWVMNFLEILYSSLFKFLKDLKIQLIYLFNNLKKYYLKKDDVTNPHRKMVNVPGNQCFLLKQLVHSKPGEKQFQINLLQHHSHGYLDSNFQKFTKTTPLSWPQECRCLSHFPLAMWGTSSPYIQSCKQAKSCHFLWAKGGKELRDGMHRITYHLLCHYVLPAFWRHKRFNALFIFSSQECGQNLTCVEDVYLASLPQHSPQSFKYVVGKENWFALQLFYSLHWILSSYCLFGFEMFSFREMSICIHCR